MKLWRISVLTVLVRLQKNLKKWVRLKTEPGLNLIKSEMVNHSSVCGKLWQMLLVEQFKRYAGTTVTVCRFIVAGLIPVQFCMQLPILSVPHSLYQTLNLIFLEDNLGYMQSKLATCSVHLTRKYRDIHFHEY